MKRVVIVGGGISGLICANVFSTFKNVSVKIIEKNKIGGDFLVGGIKYVQDTERICDLFDKLDVPWSRFVVKGGIKLGDKIYNYPGYMNRLSRSYINKINKDFFYKTRHILSDDILTNSMCDPVAVRQKKAVRCDFSEFVNKLSKNLKIIKANVFKIDNGKVYARNIDISGVIYYDYLIITIPLWEIKKISYFDVPSCMATTLNIAIVNPVSDCYGKFDYVYTPYTPCDSIHRISIDGCDYVAETSGEFDEDNFQSDLNFLFRDGWYVKNIVNNLKGYLFPLDEKIKTPDNVFLLGKFASWDQLSTVDRVLDNVYSVGKKWFGGKNDMG